MFETTVAEQLFYDPFAENGAEQFNAPQAFILQTNLFVTLKHYDLMHNS
jgi:hypothetical protein